MAGEEGVKNSGIVMGRGTDIARETSELAYSWDSERSGKTGIV